MENFIVQQMTRDEIVAEVQKGQRMIVWVLPQWFFVRLPDSPPGELEVFHDKDKNFVLSFAREVTDHMTQKFSSILVHDIRGLAAVRPEWKTDEEALEAILKGPTTVWHKHGGE